MTTGLTYATFKTQLATLAVVEETNTAFLEVLPMAITYAENRICRDLDFLQFSETSVPQMTAGTRTLSVAEGTFVVLEQANIITPATESNPNGANATRNPCLPVTKEFLDAVYGSNAGANRAMPQFFAPFNDNQFLFGPVPDQNYYVELVGMIRPASLSATNTTTFISTYLPDLMIMAAMIYVSGYQRNFGKQSDDPAMAVSYESQYNALKQGATVEEARKKFEASGWTSQSPATVASSGR